MNIITECLWAGVTCESCCRTGKGKEGKRPSSSSGPMLLHSFGHMSYWSRPSFVSHRLMYRSCTGCVAICTGLRPATEGWNIITDMVSTTHKPRGFVDRAGRLTRQHRCLFFWDCASLETHKWTDMWEIMQTLITHLRGECSHSQQWILMWRLLLRLFVDTTHMNLFSRCLDNLWLV